MDGRRLLALEAVDQFGSGERDRIAGYIERVGFISEAIQKALPAFLEKRKFSTLTYQEQQKCLMDILKEPAWGQTGGKNLPQRSPYELAGPFAVEDYYHWGGKSGAGYRADVKIDGRSIAIFAPRADMPEIQYAANGLAGLPVQFRRLVKTFYIEPSTANEFNGSKHDFWMRLNWTPSQEAVDSTLSHEIGHILFYNFNVGRDWEAAIRGDITPVSGYGKMNFNEDFAEFCRLYICHQTQPEKLDAIKRVFPQRFEVLLEVFERAERAKG